VGIKNILQAKLASEHKRLKCIFTSLSLKIKTGRVSCRMGFASRNPLILDCALTRRREKTVNNELYRPKPG
jgi:hypothetical protein